MENAKLKVFYSFLIAGIMITTNAGEIKQELLFSQTGLSFTHQNGYDLVRLPGLGFTQSRGAPFLPQKSVSVVIPAGMEVTGVEIIGRDYVDLAGQYRIYPTQPPRPLPMAGFVFTKPEFVSPDAKIYDRAEPYPEKLVEFTGQGSLAGYEIAGLLVRPIQYFPQEGKLRLFTRIEFAIKYGPSSKERILPRLRSRLGTLTYQKLVEQTVINPRDVTNFSPSVLSELALPAGTFEHLIITAEAYRAHFQPLSDWLTKKGIPDTIVSVEYIYSHYTGRDNQERIRNFIIDAYKNWGTVWVLLGGDTDVVPVRTAFAFESQAGIAWDEDSLKCDLYYSDLDGTWDANNNNLFGEFGDNIDMYSDVFVGRASINSTAEADIFVAKVLTYEKNPPLTNYPLAMMFLAYHLDDATHAEYAKDMIDDNCVPARFDPITKLYQDNGAWGRDTAIAELDRGKNIINHIDHANWNVLGVGAYNYGEGLYNSDMDVLTNGNKLAIMYSVGCLPAAIDYDCIAEHFVNAANGGGVAFVGNSRYGWYASGYAEAYSGEFDNEFFNALFNNDNYQLGRTLAESKIPFISLARNSADPQNVYRWCEYEINLLGEPALGTWTDAPTTLTVTYPPAIPTGPQNFTVTVAKSGAPQPNALVCVWKGEEVYNHGLTDRSGSVTLAINPLSGGSMLVTVTAENGLPFEDSCDVQGILMPDIKVFPDTLLFDCSGGRGTLRYTTSRHISPRSVLLGHHALKPLRHHSNLVPPAARSTSRNNLLLLAGLDTLAHSFESPFSIWPDQGYPDNEVEYEAACLTPARLCSLKFVEICFFNPDSTPASKTCSLFVWQDRVGTPGKRNLAEEFTVTLNASETIWWQIDISNQNLAYNSPFWIGHFENTAGGPSSLFDQNPTPGDYYSPDGSFWQVDVGDYLQRVLGVFAQANMLVDTMLVTNVGLESLVVTGIVPSASWITVIDPQTFTVPVGRSQAVAIMVDTAGLADGVYRGTISIASNDPNENPYSEPVKLIKGPQPHIVVTPDTLAFQFDSTATQTSTQDSPPTKKSGVRRSAPLATDTQIMWVKNEGKGNLIVTRILTDASWITAIQPTRFTVIPNDSQAVAVTADDGGVGPGIHNDYLTIESNDPDKNYYIEPMKLFKAGPPDIATRPDTIVFDLTRGMVSMLDTIWVSNTGWDTLIVDADTRTSWIIGLLPKHLDLPIADSQFILVRVDTSGIRDTADNYYGEILLHNNSSDKDPYHQPVKIVMPPRGIGDVNGKLPTVFDLSPITPNPLLLTKITDIHYALPKTSAVSLKVFDLTGKLVKTLVTAIQPANFYTLRWNSRDDAGRLLAKGVYFIRLDTPGYKKTRKLILVH
jgi:hypothetical protein